MPKTIDPSIIITIITINEAGFKESRLQYYIRAIINY